MFNNDDEILKNKLYIDIEVPDWLSLFSQKYDYDNLLGKNVLVSSNNNRTWVGTVVDLDNPVDDGYWGINLELFNHKECGLLDLKESEIKCIEVIDKL